jgi:hypothetical protein
MPETALLNQHFDTLGAESPRFAAALIGGWLQRLRESAALGADEARLARTLAARLQADHERLAGALTQAVQAALENARAGRRPRFAPSQAMALLDIDDLTLVDEAQAERDIEISRIVQRVDLKAEWELRELLAILSRLQADDAGQRPLDLADYAGAPAVFARAISEAVQWLGLEAAQAALLMRLAGPVAAELLPPIYQRAAGQLKAQGVQPVEYRAVRAGPRPPAGAAASAAPAAPVDLARLVAANASAGPAGSPEPGHELLSRLFQQIVADPRLDESVRRAIGRLEAAVMRMALADPGLLTSEEHPTWSLINQIAAHAGDHPQTQDPRGAAFLKFVEPLVEQLAGADTPRREAFAAALSDVESFIERDEALQLEKSAPAVRALSQAEHEQDLQPLLQQQVADQLVRAGPVSAPLRQFLMGRWVEVLAHAMVSLGEDAPLTRALVGTVDELLASLRMPAGEAERQRLMQALPRLIDHLQQGMQLIALPGPERERVLDALMEAHRRLLSPPAASAPPAVTAAEAAAPPETAWQDSALLSHPADEWHSSDTDLGGLPTVPMGLDETEARAVAALWLRSLRTGVRCKLFLQGQWTTARLIWRSDNGQFYMFSSPLAGGAHSMTRRAIERLRGEGLATDVAEQSLLQRAVHSLLQDLDPLAGLPRSGR